MECKKRATNRKDIIGEKYGKLTVKEFSHVDQGGKAYWKCFCDCGKEFVAQGYLLRCGMTKSCGCICSPNDEIYNNKKKDHMIKNITIDENECWNWNLMVRKDGYGEASHRNARHIKAHRLSYLIFKGEIKDNFWVLHKCDNRRCVNPDHLYLGTQEDNTKDMINRNRSNKGEDRPQSKYTEEFILDLRKMFETKKYSRTYLSKIFNINFSYVSQILNRQRWKHI